MRIKMKKRLKSKINYPSETNVVENVIYSTIMEITCLNEVYNTHIHI